MNEVFSVYEKEPSLLDARKVFIEMVEEFRKVDFGDDNIGLNPLLKALKHNEIKEDQWFGSYTINPYYTYRSNLETQKRAMLSHDLWSHFLLSTPLTMFADNINSQKFGSTPFYNPFDPKSLGRIVEDEVLDYYYSPYLNTLNCTTQEIKASNKILQNKIYINSVLSINLDQLNKLINDHFDYLDSLKQKLSFQTTLTGEEIENQAALFYLEEYSEFSFSQLQTLEENDPELLLQFNEIKSTLKSRLEKAEKLINEMRMLHERAFAFGVLYDEIQTRPGGWIEKWLTAIENSEPMPELTQEESNQIQELYANCHNNSDQAFTDFMKGKNKNEIMDEMRSRMMTLTVRITEIYDRLIEEELIEGTKSNGIQNNLLKARLQNR
jgi:hypothetical protein